MQTFDNVQHKLGEDLKETLKPRSKVSIAASVFSIYAFEALQKELSSIEAPDLDEAPLANSPKMNCFFPPASPRPTKPIEFVASTLT